VNCAAVRDRLPERALGTLDARESGAVDAHLQWCAACRKEDRDLGRAAATLAFSLAPADPDPSLEDRVVASVQERARPSAGHVSGRRGRLAIAAVAAAMMAVSGLGWGAVMAGKAARTEAQAQQTIKNGEDALDQFRTILGSSEFNDPSNEVLIGTLTPAAGETGGGAVLTLVSPSLIDMAVIKVTGLSPAVKGALPYSVRLYGPAVSPLTVGRLRVLDASGAETIAKYIDRDLSGYDRVIVRDAHGKVVMRGVLATKASVASPTP